MPASGWKTRLQRVHSLDPSFDILIEQAHKRNLKVIIDFVPNHTSNQHPRFLQSRISRSHPKRDWYIWADPSPDGSPPNNWLSMLAGSSVRPGTLWKAEVAERPHQPLPAGSSWTWDAATGQYYLHSFLEQQPDVNWRHLSVQDAMFEDMRFWLERGVDGFRYDVANFMMKDPELRDNPPNPDGILFHKERGEYGSQLHIHDRGHPDGHVILQKIRALLDAYSEQISHVAIGELASSHWRNGPVIMGPITMNCTFLSTSAF